VLFLHGGGYVIGSLDSHRHLAAEAGRAARARTLAIDYRLAPEHPFPAAVDDALAAYRFLLRGRVRPAALPRRRSPVADGSLRRCWRCAMGLPQPSVRLDDLAVGGRKSDRRRMSARLRRTKPGRRPAFSTWRSTI
jgi:hypothetical protein